MKNLFYRSNRLFKFQLYRRSYCFIVLSKIYRFCWGILFVFISDAPIKNLDHDLLNRESFVTNISDTINTIDAQDGICISLQGTWGTGKTSLINLIVDDLGTRYPDCNIIHFTPWNYVTTEQLILQFLNLLAEKFTDHNTKRDVKISNAIKEYISIIDCNNVGVKSALLLSHFLVASVSKRNTFDSSDLNKQKNKIIKLLKQQKRIVVIIDDIDRLTNEQIRLVFQLVSSVAKFPNIIYLLAYDKSIVAKALSDIQEGDGDKYIEKIVQIPISIPAIKMQELETILLNELEKVRHAFNFTYDNDYMENVYHKILVGRIDSIRSIVRFINSLCVKCFLIGKEVNFVDLIAITIIEQKQPDLYEWIVLNRKTLAHYYKNSRYASMSKDVYKEAINSDLSKTCKEKYDEYKRELDIIFPLWDDNSSYVDSRELRRDKRISHYEFVDRYFSFDLRSSDITKENVDAFIFKDSYNRMIKSFLDIKNDKDKANYLLNEIDAVILELDGERINLILKILIKYGHCLTGIIRTSLFSFYLYKSVIHIIYKLIDSCSNYNEILEFIRVEISDSDYNHLETITETLNYLIPVRNSLRSAKSSDITDIIISGELLSECISSLINRFETLNNSNKILDFDNFRCSRCLLNFYANHSSINFRKLIAETKKNKLDILKYISLFCTPINSTELEWTYMEDKQKLIPIDYVEECLNSCIKDGSIKKLSQQRQFRLVVFHIWYSTHNKGMDRISTDLIERMKNDLLG